MRIEQELENMGFALSTPKPLAAYVPARNAARLNVVDALHFE